MARAVALGYPVDEQQCLITGPDNYKVKVLPSISGRAEYFVAVALRSSSLEESQRYWCDLLGMQSLPSLSTALSTAETIKDTANTTLTVGYSAEETALHFIQVTFSFLSFNLPPSLLPAAAVPRQSTREPCAVWRKNCLRLQICSGNLSKSFCCRMSSSDSSPHPPHPWQG
jgi:hypothetical protein